MEQDAQEDVVAAQPPTPVSKPGPPAKEDAEVEKIKTSAVATFVKAARKSGYDFTRLESSASDIARVANDAASKVSEPGLRVDALKEAFAKLYGEA